MTSPRESTSRQQTTSRRTEDEMIAELEEKIRCVESRMKRKEDREQPVRKGFTRFKKHASAFAQLALDDQRTDVANTVLGMLGVVERQLEGD
ncbi:MAG: hypothetical protein PVJ89_09185 [Planctomycetota bacterium]|jgi:hypothetical protein